MFVKIDGNIKKTKDCKTKSIQFEYDARIRKYKNAIIFNFLWGVIKRSNFKELEYNFFHKRTKKMIKENLLKLLPETEQRTKFFIKMMWLLIHLHLDNAKKDKHFSYFFKKLQKKAFNTLKYWKLNKNENKAIDVLKKSDIAKHMKSVEIDFIYFSYLIYIKLVEFSVSGKKIGSLEIQKYKWNKAREIEENQQVMVQTEQTFKYIWEKHKYYLGISDKDIRK